MKSLDSFSSNEIVNSEEVKGGTFGLFSWWSCAPKITFNYCQPKQNNCYTPPKNCYTPPEDCNPKPSNCKPTTSGSISAQ